MLKLFAEPVFPAHGTEDRFRMARGARILQVEPNVEPEDAEDPATQRRRFFGCHVLAAVDDNDVAVEQIDVAAQRNKLPPYVNIDCWLKPHEAADDAGQPAAF